MSVPALPELFTEFDEIQGHRRRYLGDPARRVRGTGLEIDAGFLVGIVDGPNAPMVKEKAEGRPGESAAQTYRRHLRLLPWPVPLILRGPSPLSRTGLSRANSVPGLLCSPSLDGTPEARRNWPQ